MGVAHPQCATRMISYEMISMGCSYLTDENPLMETLLMETRLMETPLMVTPLMETPLMKIP